MLSLEWNFTRNLRGRNGLRTFLPPVAVVVLGSILLNSCVVKDSPVLDQWTVAIPEVGFASSPRAIDLNADGIQDIVIGAGGPEFNPTANGVTAIDGNNGSILWAVPTRNQIVGSAIFKDITGDQVSDVFIGGRSAVLLAIDGSNGEIIWQYLPDSDDLNLMDDTTLLNFFNPQFIPDVNGDHQEDLLVSFGGFVKAKPEEKNRPTGCLFIIDSQNGRLLKRLYMPDGAETYMSPVLQDLAEEGDLSIIFGSGGEKINGHLYRITLQAFLKDDLSQLQVLADGRGKGFIAPPVLADVNQDGIQDIVVNPVNGNMVCLDGISGTVLWEVSLDTTFEVYTTPAPGLFYGDDKIPDFFSSLGAGPWPDTRFTLQILIDGSNGNIVFSDTLGLFQYASPVVFDYDQDGQDEILLAINDQRILTDISKTAKFYVNELSVLEFSNYTYTRLGATRLGSNLGATPLLTDLDDDHRLDIIYGYMEDANHFYSFKNGKIDRFELDIPVNKTLPWGTYMGRNYRGVYVNDVR